MANADTRKAFKRREIAFAIVSIVAGVLFLIQYSRNWVFESDSLKGNPAPEIEYTTDDGKPMSLKKHQGSTILINFWASWCAPCMEEMPSLVALENHFEKQGLVLLAFNIEDTSGEVITGRIAGTKMPRNLIFNFSKEFLRPYDVRTVPLSILIDKHGTVQKVYVGPREWMRLEILREIETVLKN